MCRSVCLGGDCLLENCFDPANKKLFFFSRISRSDLHFILPPIQMGKGCLMEVMFDGGGV